MNFSIYLNKRVFVMKKKKNKKDIINLSSVEVAGGGVQVHYENMPIQIY